MALSRFLVMLVSFLHGQSMMQDVELKDVYYTHITATFVVNDYATFVFGVHELNTIVVGSLVVTLVHALQPTIVHNLLEMNENYIP